MAAQPLGLGKLVKLVARAAWQLDPHGVVLCGGALERDASGLDRLPCACAGGVWRRAGAVRYLASGIQERSKGRINFRHSPLDATSGYPWDADIATLPIAGDFMTEVEFFHRTSRTLILTDFIENFEPGKLSLWMRILTKLGGVSDPDGQMPRDMRWTFKRQKQELRLAVEQMIAWSPERVILAHGRWYAEDGEAQLRRAFRWLTGGSEVRGLATEE
jgi:hypothetical protein